MPERILNPSEKELVTAEEVRDQLSGHVEAIVAALLKQAQTYDYRMDDVQAALDYLHDKTELFSKGLLPADDFTFLSKELRYWLGMATSIQSINSIEASDRIIRHAVDAVQGAMVVNNLLGKETVDELVQRWPTKDTSA